MELPSGRFFFDKQEATYRYFIVRQNLFCRMDFEKPENQPFTAPAIKLS